jgi:hypothetical protein
LASAGRTTTGLALLDGPMDEADGDADGGIALPCDVPAPPHPATTIITKTNAGPAVTLRRAMRGR